MPILLEKLGAPAHYRPQFGVAQQTFSHIELREQEPARRHDGARGGAEFWEEDFPELARYKVTAV